MITYLTIIAELNDRFATLPARPGCGCRRAEDPLTGLPPPI
jgi:hypothetical protein